MIGRRKVWLLPCPFCGGKATLENCVFDAAIFCNCCRAKITRSHGDMGDTGIKAAKMAWNKRTKTGEEVIGLPRKRKTPADDLPGSY